MKYEIPEMDITYFRKANVITTSDGLVEGDDKLHGDDF